MEMFQSCKLLTNVAFSSTEKVSRDLGGSIIFCFHIHLEYEVIYVKTFKGGRSANNFRNLQIRKVVVLPKFLDATICGFVQTQTFFIFADLWLIDPLSFCRLTTSAKPHILFINKEIYLDRMVHKN